MKEHITPKQAKEITEEQFYTLFPAGIVPRADWANTHHKKVTVGKMIESLSEVAIVRKTPNDLWNVTAFRCNKTYQGHELVDTLWKAIKNQFAKTQPAAERKAVE